jgi:Zn-dependent peptidase ImmA (M78 family)
MPDPLVDRVRTIIEQVADSHAAFAARIDISKDKLSKSLAGTRRFTSLELALIAEAGGVTVDWLLTGKTPAHPALAARTSAATIPDVSEVNELADRYAAAFDVLELLGHSVHAPALPVLPSGLSLRGQGNLLASQALTMLSHHGHETISDLRISDLVSVVENVFGVHVAVDRLPSGLDGLAWQTDHHRLILLTATRKWTRQRFTFAHELGHILAGDAQQVVIDQHLAPGVDTDPTEVRANQFAAVLLMPETELRARVTGPVDDRSFARLTVDFKVSPSAMAVRLRSLGLIGTPRFEQVRGMSSMACHQLAGTLDGYLAHVNEALAARLPSRLVAALFSAYQDGQTTLRPLANLLDVEVDELYEILAGTPEQATSSGTDSEPVYSL